MDPPSDSSIRASPPRVASFSEGTARLVTVTWILVKGNFNETAGSQISHRNEPRDPAPSLAASTWKLQP